MAVSVTPTEDTMMLAVRNFLLAIVPSGVEVFQSQANRVAEPAGVDFIMMTPTTRKRLATNVTNWDRQALAPTTEARAHDTQVMVQLDLHGPNGSDYAQTVATLWRDQYGCEVLAPAGIQPLFASDGVQAPFRNAEQQYENRWTMQLALQAVPIVSTPQDFAATLTATIKPVT